MVTLPTRPRLLDLFCGAGGCAVGYHRAGFDVVGIDLHPQPNYPFEFVQADALEFMREGGGAWGARQFDAIHASPPCQAYSALRTLSDNEHADLVGPTRELLEATGLPYVIENVPGSPVRRDFILCGSMFGLGATCRDGIWRQLRRHRWFETNFGFGLVPSCQHQGQPVGVYGHGGGGQMTRGYKATKSEAEACLGIDWMDRRELSQAIPPAFAQYVGEHLLAHVRQVAA